MTEPVFMIRRDFEERLDQFKVAMLAEIAHANLAQDTAFNLGFRAIREDLSHAIAAGVTDLKSEMRGLVTEKYLEAIVDPVRRLAYGALAMFGGLVISLVLAALSMLRSVGR